MTWQLIDGDFRSTIAATATRNRLYMIDQDSGFYPVVPDTGVREESIDQGWTSRELVALGERLFVAESTLYRITLADRRCEELADSWHQLAATIDRLFAIDARALYTIDPDTAVATMLENSWDVDHLIGVGEQLFAFEAHGLYRVDPRTGGCTQLPGSWHQVSAVASAGGQLFAIDAGMLYRIDVQTGDTEELCASTHTRLLVGCGGWLYAIEDSGELYRLPVA